LGEVVPPIKSQHVSSLICVGLAIVVVLTGTWIYIWQLLGGANQLMAALALLLVTVWLASVGKNWLYAGLPALFMYVTTVCSLFVTAYNLYVNVYQVNAAAGRVAPVVGSALLMAIAMLLVVAAVFIGYDGVRAFMRYRKRPMVTPTAAPARA